jgi:hypothetical protein
MAPVAALRVTCMPEKRVAPGVIPLAATPEALVLRKCCTL